MLNQLVHRGLLKVNYIAPVDDQQNEKNYKTLINNH